MLSRLLLPLLLTAAALPPRADLAAFAVPWDAASTAALAAHGGRIGTAALARITVAGPDHAVTVAPDPAARAALAGLARPPAVLLMVQDIAAGAWDGAGATALLADPAARDALAGRLRQEVAAVGAAGVVIDFEGLPAAAWPTLARWLGELRGRVGGTVWVAAPADDPAVDLAGLAAADRVVLMLYDDHYQGGAPGPIAPAGWFADRLRAALAQVPRGKVVAGVASYAYDWGEGLPTRALSVADAAALAAAHGVAPALDPASGNAHFAYADAGVAHQVWMVGASAVAAEVAAARRQGVGTVALWRLGTEDPAVW